jgi:lipid-A-disaccharide synthase
MLPVPGSVPAHAVMGTSELAGGATRIVRNAWALRGALADADLLVTIDGPDFHLPLARAARARGIPVVGYVSPQVWAWRGGRIPAIARAYDRLLCLFAFEPALYAGTALDARWVGHPAVDGAAPSRREDGVLALLPGSRTSEVRAHLSDYLSTAALLREGVEGWRAREVLLPRAPMLEEGLLAHLPAWVRVTTREEVLARAERALTKSGTSTLELALAGIPSVVAHRTGWLTWQLARRLVRHVGPATTPPASPTGAAPGAHRNRLPRVALPNLLLGEDVFVERLQDFRPADLAADVARAAAPPTDRLAALLRPPGGTAAEHAAAAVLDLVRGGSRQPPKIASQSVST